MKISINKSAKRVLSTALALAMVIGTLFTANVGTTLVANAEATQIKEGTIDLLEFGSYLTEMGSSSQYYDSVLADNGETGTSWDDAIIIDSAEEFVYLSKMGAGAAASAGKYYKVADGIAGFDLSEGNLNLDGTLAENLEKIQAGGKNHSGDSTNSFQGNFDGNGVTIYGAVISGGTYSGLFSCTKNTVLIKNVNVRLCSFKGSATAGGIVGFHTADVIAFEKDAPIHTLTIENCTVADTYIECTGNGYGTGVGAILGRGNSAPSWKEADKGVDGNGDGDTVDTIYVNVPYIIKNCFVNQDENYFKSAAEDGVESSGERACHGGVVGMSGSNALTVSDCVIIGITPYATTESTGYNDVQHSGLATHFKNVYTDQATGSIVIGGQPSWVGRTQDFSTVVFQLTDAQLKGAAAVSNMNLAWFSAWLPGGDGKYPIVNQTATESDTYFWDGTADTKYAGGTGTKEDPYIIKTPAQLYAALSTVTGTTEGVHAYESKEVAGGIQSGKILRQGSTTDYVAVYTPYYYKVADGVKNFYFNNVYGNETLAGIKALVAGGKAKNWVPGKSFVGHIDGNGVTIHGMYSNNGAGFVYKLDGAAEVKNFAFNACYSSGSNKAAILTTNLGSYANDTTLISVSNISVRNAYCASTSSLKITTNASNGMPEHGRYAGGIVSTDSTAENFTMSNCFYDGYTSEIVNGADSQIPSTMVGGIIAGGSGMNNVLLNGCVALGAPVVDIAYVEGYEFFYNRYDATLGFQVFFYDCYTDVQEQITAAYPGKYDKLLAIEVIETANTYSKFDFPTLGWSNWALVTDGGRTFPMPTVNTATESIGSYIQLIGQGQNNYAGVGPYAYGSNPYTWLLKGKGTEEDPYLIENAEQLARAIATGGMNLYDRLYYRLDTDLDLSGGAWINQTKRAEGGIYYTYTPFGGQLDGNGHTITGLSAGDTNSAGLIPVLTSTGVVKNLHVRNSAAVSSKYAGIIAGETQTGSQIIGCSVENCEAQGKLGTNVIAGDKNVTLDTVYYTNADAEYYLANGTEYNASNYMDIFKVEANKGIWYIGGKEGSRPKLKNANGLSNDLDIDGDGVNGYAASDLTALRNKLLRKSAYANINGDVSRNGVINIADLAVLQRTIVDDYGSKVTDSFFANVKQGQIEIYYGENDNYDAARKVELYLESLFPGLDVEKHVSSSKGTVTGANSDASKVYLHAGDKVGNPDGELDIIVGDVVGYTAGLAANKYEVTYDSANKVVWLKGENFTAVEQAVINFVNGSKVDGDVVYTCGVTELEDYKKPVTVKLDTNFDGTIDTDKVLYYAWGDEFDSDTVDTHNWQHNTQQTEGMSGDSYSSYKDQEVAPVVELNKLLTIEDGKLMMKRGYRNGITVDGTKYTGNTESGVIALDITDSFNGYNDQNGNPAIQDDDNYFTSGKVTTERGMLYKQGYIEFSGRIPADGHAFPAWWLMARPAQSATNHGYDNSLYGKVYKINSKWNGSNTFDEDNLDTFKYQLPSAIYEIDMIEVMQHVDRHRTKAGENEWGINLGGSRYNNDYLTYTKAVNLYYLNTTIHKWWNNGVDNQNTADTSDDRLHIIDWDNYTVSSGITNSDFSTTSSADSWIHNPGSTQYDFGTPTQTKLSTLYYKTQDFSQTAHDALTLERRYGFSWYTNGTGFEATLYIYNADGTLLTTVPIASGDSDGINTFKDNNKVAESSGIIGTVDGGAFKNIYSDAKVFNQYMYILFDNKYYSSNDNQEDLVFTDLLTSLGLKTFEIDYVRVYQQDNQRDIVTQATENFNNNNHFGY